MNVKVTNGIKVNLPLAGASRVRSVRDFHRAGRRIVDKTMKLKIEIVMDINGNRVGEARVTR